MTVIDNDKYATIKSTRLFFSNKVERKMSEILLIRAGTSSFRDNLKNVRFSHFTDNMRKCFEHVLNIKFFYA